MCKLENRYYTCTKEKSETKSRIIIDTFNEFVATLVCCDGYEEIDQKCAPICENSCDNGYCSTPNQCECNDNYTLTEISRYFCHSKSNKIKNNIKQLHIFNVKCPTLSAQL